MSDDVWLEHSEAWRGGVTARHIRFAGKITLGASPEEGIVDLSVSITSKGGGFTNVILRLHEADFHHLRKAMKEVEG